MMITGLMFRDGVISGSNNIANNRQAVDALNIFPVPDGDTGTNMSMTIGAAAKEMAVLPENCTVEEASARCASALLRGARGNSGVILSLIFRGFSKALRGMEEADGAAVAAAVRAIAAAGIPVNVTAVVPCCENRISTTSLLPGDLIGSLSGKTIEVFNADAEGRLILADGLTWAIRKEGCTRLVDAATLTGAICAMLGYVATGVMASDDGWYAALERAAAHSGERFWRMPDFPEYEKLIRGDLGDVRNTSRDGCGAITAGLFLRHFTEGLPWLHLDIAGTADNKGYVWEHQVPGATGTAVSTLFHLACGLAEIKEEAK